MKTKWGLFLLLILFAILGYTIYYSYYRKFDPLQAKIEEAKEKTFKELKSEDPNVRSEAIFYLGLLDAKEHTKDIAMFLKDKDENIRRNAIWALGWLGAKEYTKEIVSSLKDDTKVIFCNCETTISSVAEQVLKEWGVDTDKLKEKK